DGVSDLAIANAPPPQSGVPAAVSIVSGADGSLLARGPSRAASLAFAGDLDGEPGDELLIGIQGSPGGPQPGGEPIPGRVVILRFAGGGDPSTAAIVHAQIDAPEARSLFGASLAALGDVDGDGTADLAVGAPLAPSTDLVNVGRVTIYSGASLEPIHALFGIGSGQVLGGALAGPIDVDGDGRGDLLSSARRRGRNVARVFRLGDRDKNGLRDACESCAEAATLMPDGKPAVFSLCPVTPERCFIVRPVLRATLRIALRGAGAGTLAMLTTRAGAPPATGSDVARGERRDDDFEEILVPNASRANLFIAVRQ